jgi:dolichol-phosphate mannosyltransferase
MNLSLFEKNPRLLSRLLRIFKFGTVGASGVVVNSGVLFFLTEKFNFDYRISALVAIELSIINNFVWNTWWTWSDKKASVYAQFLKRLLKFQLSTSIVAIVNYALLIGLTELFHIPYLISNLTGIAVGSTLNFLIGHFWIFSIEKSVE